MVALPRLECGSYYVALPRLCGENVVVVCGTA